MARRFHTAAEEIRLVREAQGGDVAARNELIEVNLPIVYKIAVRVARRFKRVTADELAAEGVLGFIRAIEKFDLSRGFRLTTYCMYWVRQSIGVYLLETRSIVRVPRYVTADSGHRASRNAFAATAPMYSLSLSKQEVDGNLQYEPIANRTVAAYAPTCEEMNNAMAALTDRQRLVIGMRIDGLTLKQIGDEIGCSKERVRQIEDRARRRMAAILGDALPSQVHARLNRKRKDPEGD